MKKFFRDDYSKIAGLLYESPMEPAMDVGLDLSFDDEQGGFEDEGFGGDVDVVEIGGEVDPAPVGMAPVPSGYADEDTKVLKANLKKLADYAGRLQQMDPSTFEPWMAAKITLAADYADDVWHMLDAEADFANTGFEQAGPEQNIGF